MPSKFQPERDRTICFVAVDFDPFFIAAGIEDPNTITLSEWRSFENMFMEGTSWPEVAKIAAEEIAWERNNK